MAGPRASGKHATPSMPTQAIHMNAVIHRPARGAVMP